MTLNIEPVFCVIVNIQLNYRYNNITLEQYIRENNMSCIHIKIKKRQLCYQ